MDEGMVFVYQDARGRNYSEGVFTEMMPHRDVKKGPKDVDESTDSYDTIDWLIRNIPHNNGRVGIVGGSYPGFYTTASCIDAHPALKACSPQAPMTDIAMGDDVFHNGAFLLSFEPPTLFRPRNQPALEYTSYVSDPAKPVPLVDRVESQGMPRDYITADQRFAARRTDADFVVKLIDVFPDDARNWPGDSSGFRVGGYQQLVRGEPFRGKFRRSFSDPAPFVPNEPDSIRFAMPDINHTFRKGHRIMVQVQSTWFPHIDRNPQTFLPNIFFARPEDFRTATMRVYHSPARATRIEVGVVTAPKM
jgi:predicted acyl esterase